MFLLWKEKRGYRYDRIKWKIIESTLNRKEGGYRYDKTKDRLLNLLLKKQLLVLNVLHWIGLLDIAYKFCILKYEFEINLF